MFTAYSTSTRHDNSVNFTVLRSLFFSCGVCTITRNVTSVLDTKITSGYFSVFFSAKAFFISSFFGLQWNKARSTCNGKPARTNFTHGASLAASSQLLFGSEGGGGNRLLPSGTRSNSTKCKIMNEATRLKHGIVFFKSSFGPRRLATRHHTSLQISHAATCSVLSLCSLTGNISNSLWRQHKNSQMFPITQRLQRKLIS